MQITIQSVAKFGKSSAIGIHQIVESEYDIDDAIYNMERDGFSAIHFYITDLKFKKSILIALQSYLAIDAQREANFKAFEAFRDKFTGLVFKAEVVWFDKASGEGIARGLNGEGRWPLYACNIKGNKSLYPETACVSHAEGQIFDAEIKVFYGGSILISHTQGTLDESRWNSLNQ